MPNVKDCPGFETFGADVQQAREAVKMSRRELAEKISIDPRYLANIELCGTIPSVPVVMQLIRICKLPAERYFNPELLREDSEQRQRTSHKLQLLEKSQWQQKTAQPSRSDCFLYYLASKQYPISRTHRISNFRSGQALYSFSLNLHTWDPIVLFSISCT